MVLPALEEKNLAKFSKENDKKLLWLLDRLKRERKTFETFEIVNEHVRNKSFKKTLYSIFD